MNSRSLSYAGVSAPPLCSHSGHCDALGVFDFHHFKKEMSAGRIKIGRQGTISRDVYTFHLRDWNCLRVFLALLLWRKLGFPTKTSFNGHQPL